MKILAKFSIIINLVFIMTGCNWLNWNPTYYDEEWVVEKVEYISGSKMIEVFIEPQNMIYGFDFWMDEKLQNSFNFISICSIADLAFSKEQTYTNILFTSTTVLDQSVHTTMQFDTTKIFYKSQVMSESLIRPGKIWRCRITTPSMPITYIDP